VLFAVVAAGTSYALSRSPVALADREQGATATDTPDREEPPGATAGMDAPAPRPGPARPGDAARTLPVWRIDYDDSDVVFVAEQAGASFEGRWKDWSATMRFDDADLGASSFDVTIQIASVDTRDEERDMTLMDPDWFNEPEYKTVRFVTYGFAATGKNSYEATSKLIVKGRAAPVIFVFSLEANGDKRLLRGSARLDRLALGLGTGEWEDTQWVGQFVDVNVRVAATVSQQQSNTE